MDFLTLAAERFSCRKFSPQPVEPEKIQQILKAAVLAPTAVNMQPFHIWIADTDAAKEAVRSSTTCHFGAETLLIVGAKPEDGWVRKFDGRHFADVDAAIAATHMLMEIQDLGLATTWVGYFDAPKLQQLLPQLQGWDLIAIFPVGYPADVPSPRHSQRKSQEELVFSL